MGPKCADSCHAGRPQAAILWFHRAMSPPPEIDGFAPLEANCSIFEQQPRPKPETAHSQSRWGLDRWTAFQLFLYSGRNGGRSPCASTQCLRARALRKRFGGECLTRAPEKPKPRTPATSSDAQAVRREAEEDWSKERRR